MDKKTSELIAKVPQVTLVFWIIRIFYWVTIMFSQTLGMVRTEITQTTPARSLVRRRKVRGAYGLESLGP